MGESLLLILIVYYRRLNGWFYYFSLYHFVKLHRSHRRSSIAWIFLSGSSVVGRKKNWWNYSNLNILVDTVDIPIKSCGSVFLWVSDRTEERFSSLLFFIFVELKKISVRRFGKFKINGNSLFKETNRRLKRLKSLVWWQYVLRTPC